MCEMSFFGNSGEVQNASGVCNLPINIINEKIYVFLWFWFILLTVVTSLDLIHHFCLVWFESVRLIILKRKLRRSPKYKVEKLERIKQSQLDRAAKKAAQDAEVKARQAKYANRR